ncbi:uncharacterized protein LOC123939906 [Meles meles]|uniref:uncharacterized protein LOC123939906 n=1 Tax=Meles meles TaxID=9662 RepID=UPI001E69ECB0|nr:uncharacterized protein LOC123939906 [Meles meles]
MRNSEAHKEITSAAKLSLKAKLPDAESMAPSEYQIPHRDPILQRVHSGFLQRPNFSLSANTAIFSRVRGILSYVAGSSIPVAQVLLPESTTCSRRYSDGVQRAGAFVGWESGMKPGLQHLLPASAKARPGATSDAMGGFERKALPAHSLRSFSSFQEPQMISPGGKDHPPPSLAAPSRLGKTRGPRCLGNRGGRWKASAPAARLRRC